MTLPGGLPAPHSSCPASVQLITLVLRPMPGVAHTFGSPTTKEIHFSLDHIRNSQSRAKDEILGVLVHEMVHCYQYDGQGKTPGGLIEGIADWVRLNAGYVPPHWKKEADGDWDGGYQKTAYFLNWIEGRYGDGSIQELNAGMKDAAYNEHVFKDVTGRKVSKLWKLYKEHLEAGVSPLYSPLGKCLMTDHELGLQFKDQTDAGDRYRIFMARSVVARYLR